MVYISHGAGFSRRQNLCNVMRALAFIKSVLDGFRMPVEWTLCIVVPIFKGSGGIRNSSCYRAVKFLEHGMDVVERVLGKRICIIVSIDEMQFGFMPEGGTIDTVFILRRMQEKYHDERKSCICILWA